MARPKTSRRCAREAADGYRAVSCHVLAENFRAQRFVTSRLTDVAAHVQDGGYAYRARLDAQAIDD